MAADPNSTNVLPAPVSQRFTFKGYSFKQWAIKNKDYLKILFSVGTGLVTYALVNVPSPFKEAIGTVTAATSQMILSAIDYWQSE